MGRFKPVSTPAEIAERELARAAKLEVLHSTLTVQVAAIRGGQDWKDWLGVAARFHSYSLNNILLIAAQRPTATAVAGFEAWKALGRQVDKGQKGIQILAPMVHRPSAGGADDVDAARAADTAPGRQPDPAGTQAGPADTARGRVAGFRVVHVFDLSQTSGEPLPQQPKPLLLAGQAPAGLWDALAAQVGERGFTLHRGDCGPDINGLTHYGQRTVTVRTDVDDAQAVKTLAHELGHVLLHDPTPPATIDVPDIPGVAVVASATTPGVEPELTSHAQCRGRVEVEAESVAYLVTHTHGLDTGAYTFPYVAGWASAVDAITPETVVRATAGRVLAAARMVLTSTEHLRTEPAPAGPIRTRQVALAAELQTGAEQGAARTAALLASATHTEQAANQRPAAAVGRSGPAPSPSPERLVQVHALAVAFYTARLHADGVDEWRAAGLLTVRDVDAGAAAQAGLGYAPRAWTALVEHLRAAGVDDLELLASGLVTTSARGALIDRFRDRIIFPVQTEPGQTVGLLGRAVAPSTDRSGGPIPKYLNSPETVLYRKAEVLYGLGQAAASLAAGAVPVLVEGPMDVLAINRASQHGAPNATATPMPLFAALAPCGTALTASQVALLDQATPGGLADRGVVVAFDSDDAGRAATLRAFHLLRAVGAWPHTIDLPDWYDPALLLQKHGPAALHAELRAAASRPLADVVINERIDRYTDQLRWAEGRLAAGRSAATVIATFPADHVGRQVARLATSLALPVATVTELVVEAATAPTRTAHHDHPAPPQSGAAPTGQVAAARPRPAQPPTCEPDRGTVAVPPTAAQRARAGFPETLRTTLHLPYAAAAADPATAGGAGPRTPSVPSAAGHLYRS